MVAGQINKEKGKIYSTSSSIKTSSDIPDRDSIYRVIRNDQNFDDINTIIKNFVRSQLFYLMIGKCKNDISISKSERKILNTQKS